MFIIECVLIWNYVKKVSVMQTGGNLLMMDLSITDVQILKERVCTGVHYQVKQEACTVSLKLNSPLKPHFEVLLESPKKHISICIWMLFDFVKLFGTFYE